MLSLPESWLSEFETVSANRRAVLVAFRESGLQEIFQQVGDGGMALDELRAKTSLPAASLRLMLMLGCSLRLLRRQPGTLEYHARAALLRPPTSRERHLIGASLSHLAASIKSGTNAGLEVLHGSAPTLYERLAQFPDLERHYVRGLENMNRRVRVPLVLAGVERLRGNVNRVLDVGGNIGVAADAIVNRFAGVRVTVFDLPSICREGRRRCTNPAVNFIAGRIGCDPFPPGFDCLVFSAILEVIPEASIMQVLKSAHDALPAGGHIIVVQWASNDLETGPLNAALSALYFFNVCVPSPMSIAPSDLHERALACGFRTFEMARLRGNPLRLMIIGK